ncbi:MAG TPA: hypothetical protein ENN80_05925 [Candidatus Hydrogenedentes bacterium]|nr:hypothetical protein [Candidatus Hydrogenedentota bacterium]
MDGAQSHLSFFGLNEQPFAPTADPAYFYATRSHKECLFRLWNSIDQRLGIAVVLGNYGTGKTTLLRKLITGMRADPERYNTAVIGSPIPSWTSFALLESIVSQFRLQPDETSFVAYMEALNQYLLECRDRISTLIIDDAQNLNKRGQLELLRLVQNLETQQHKLLNLVFFAQLEWIEVLHAAPNFEQRINTTYTLEPIRFEETRHFIDFRLAQAGVNPDNGVVFADVALRAIHAYAEGNPRVIVTLCRNAMLFAAQVGSREIGQDIILHTIEKTTVPDRARRARAVAAVMEQLPERPSNAARASRAAPVPSDEGPPPRDERAERASRLLLKGATDRSRPTG